ncbi:MAG: hypothetical protein H6625_07225 [Bdellovibrionaceae bacterium]|nr:hypothetical protein [Pseudobdellovibrionaceae bacterium]
MKFKKIKLIFLVFLLYSTVVIENIRYFNKLETDESPKLYIPPPENINLMTFGYHENFADSLWLRWLQNPEDCGKEKIPRLVFEKEYEGYKSKHKDLYKLDLGFDRNKRKVCDKGWSFLMLDAISNLAPKFRYVYLIGTSILSVIVDDHEGAAIIYEKALKQFPQDWKLYYGAAYHYMYELDDTSKAAEYLRKAGNYGAPSWVFSLASKLYTKSGQAFLGLTSLKQYREIISKTGDLVKLNLIDERISVLEKQLKLIK